MLDKVKSWFKKKEKEIKGFYVVRLEVIAPSGKGKTSQKWITKIFPRGVNTYASRVITLDNCDKVYWYIDCRDSRRYRKLIQKVAGFKEFSKIILESKTSTTLLKRLADDPKDVDIIKEMIYEGTELKLIRKNEIRKTTKDNN
tara:strand:- start:1155 stop:1583 length:429 start_codon:yes stop_codon:yes gene_type:complete